MRPVRHHLGITAFGTNAWRGENVGDRLVPSHAEDPRATRSSTSSLRGRARFEIDGETVDAPRARSSTCARGRPRPPSRRRPERRCSRSAARSARRTTAAAGRSGRRSIPPYEAGDYEGVIETRARDARGERLRRAALQPRVLRGAGRAHRGRDRPPRRRVREAAGPPRPREGGHRPRRAPGRAGLPGAPRLARFGSTASASGGGRSSSSTGSRSRSPPARSPGLLGPSGSGKSTLIRSIVGVQIVEAGEVQRARPARRLGGAARACRLRDAGALGVRRPDRPRESPLLRPHPRRRRRPDRGGDRRGRPAAPSATSSSPASRAASARGSRSRLRSSTVPSCSSSTSRPSGSTRCSAATSGSSSTRWPPQARRSSSRAT